MNLFPHNRVTPVPLSPPRHARPGTRPEGRTGPTGISVAAVIDGGGSSLIDLPLDLPHLEPRLEPPSPEGHANQTGPGRDAIGARRQPSPGRVPTALLKRWRKIPRTFHAAPGRYAPVDDDASRGRATMPDPPDRIASELGADRVRTIPVRHAAAISRDHRPHAPSPPPISEGREPSAPRTAASAPPGHFTDRRRLERLALAELPNGPRHRCVAKPAPEDAARFGGRSSPSHKRRFRAFAPTVHAGVSVHVRTRSIRLRRPDEPSRYDSTITSSKTHLVRQDGSGEGGIC